MASESATSVWGALADTPEEAENLRIRSGLMRAINRAVKSWDVPQTEAARRLNISQPQLNDLLEGKIDKFSLDDLIKVRAAL
jgi:predicted XRE-type DNA-binding protein